MDQISLCEPGQAEFVLGERASSELRYGSAAAQNIAAGCSQDPHSNLLLICR